MRKYRLDLPNGPRSMLTTIRQLKYAERWNGKNPVRVIVDLPGYRALKAECEELGLSHRRVLDMQVVCDPDGPFINVESDTVPDLSGYTWN